MDRIREAIDAHRDRACLGCTSEERIAEATRRGFNDRELAHYLRETSNHGAQAVARMMAASLRRRK